MSLKVSNNEVERIDTHASRKRGYRVVLSIAGSDSSGGAGIQADLKTLSSLGIYGATAITAITAQNTQGVRAQLAIAPEMVFDQISAVIEDIAPCIIKIGMLSNTEIANAVADALKEYDVPIILDPVMVSSSGHRLLSAEAQEVIKQRLLPMTRLITPNIPEMEALAAMSVSTTAQKAQAANYLISLGAQAVLLKGGHEEGDIKSDTLYQHTSQGTKVSTFAAPTIATHNIHGTGCTLSSAIAAYMAHGYALEEAVGMAKSYINRAIEAGADIAIGKGFGPVNHLYEPLKMQIYEE